jgi:septal ring factor EnvC (AmiA/AmiB activator)
MEIDKYIYMNVGQNNYENGLSLGNKDMLLHLLESKIHELEDIKHNHLREVREKSNVNTFLYSVYTDYENKKNNIIRMKEKQQQQILSIIDYLENTIKDIQLTKTDLNQVHKERKQLLKEIDNIQKEIDSLIDEE